MIALTPEIAFAKDRGDPCGRSGRPLTHGMTVLVAGAGIGGLTLALMLHRCGIPLPGVRTGRSEVRELGVGINTLPHAIRELAALDLLPALDDGRHPHA